MRRKWDIETDNTLIRLRQSGKAYKEIASILDRTDTSIRQRASKLMKEGKLLYTNKYLEDKDLLAYVIQYQTYWNMRLAKEASANIPHPDTIQTRFGSWAKALEAAGLDHNINSYRTDCPTLLYLIHFYNEDFYKIGITQGTLKERFSGYPKFKLIDSVMLPTYGEAKELEREALANTEQYIPDSFKQRAGYTECFKLDQVRMLEDFY